jgi:enoyl-CoA hydratase/carnithine racemase
MSARVAQHFENFDVTFPDDRIIQVTLTRTQKLNCIDKATSREISKTWERLDEDETLWLGIITGAGRAFCTGADLQGKGSLKHQVTSPNTR